MKIKNGSMSSPALVRPPGHGSVLQCDGGAALPMATNWSLSRAPPQETDAMNRRSSLPSFPASGRTVHVCSRRHATGSSASPHPCNGFVLLLLMAVRELTSLTS